MNNTLIVLLTTSLLLNAASSYAQATTPQEHLKLAESLCTSPDTAPLPLEDSAVEVKDVVVRGTVLGTETSYRTEHHEIKFENIEPPRSPRRMVYTICLLYTSPSPRDQRGSRMPSSA